MLTDAELNPLPKPDLAPESQAEIPHRFNLPDLDRHAGWLLPRMNLIYGHLSERQAHGWLRSVLGSNEFMILSASYGVALFQQVHPSLASAPVVKQHFCWLCDPQNKNYQREGAEFYVALEQWAKRMSITRLIDIDINNDVPLEFVAKKLGKLNAHTQVFANIAARKMT